MEFIEKFFTDCIKSFYIFRALDRFCNLTDCIECIRIPYSAPIKKYIAKETLSLIDDYLKVN
jgi:hypothetical protein